MKINSIKYLTYFFSIIFFLSSCQVKNYDKKQFEKIVNIFNSIDKDLLSYNIESRSTPFIYYEFEGFDLDSLKGEACLIGTLDEEVENRQEILDILNSEGYSKFGWFLVYVSIDDCDGPFYEMDSLEYYKVKQGAEYQILKLEKGLWKTVKKSITNEGELPRAIALREFEENSFSFEKNYQRIIIPNKLESVKYEKDTEIIENLFNGKKIVNWKEGPEIIELNRIDKNTEATVCLLTNANSDSCYIGALIEKKGETSTIISKGFNATSIDYKSIQKLFSKKKGFLYIDQSMRYHIDFSFKFENSDFYLIRKKYHNYDNGKINEVDLKNQILKIENKEIKVNCSIVPISDFSYKDLNTCFYE